MMPIEPGDILLVPFPFTDQSAVKQRPAVVISSREYNDSHPDVILAPITIPLAWFPRLFHATSTERGNWRWIGGGIGIHLPDLDEDIAVEDLLLGRPSGESQESLRRWLEQRTVDRE